MAAVEREKKIYRPFTRIVTTKLSSPRFLATRCEDFTLLGVAFTTSDRFRLLATPTSLHVSHGAWKAFTFVAKFLTDVISAG